MGKTVITWLGGFRLFYHKTETKLFCFSFVSVLFQMYPLFNIYLCDSNVKCL